MYPVTTASASVPESRIRRVAFALGKVVGIACIVAAGVGGWFAVDAYVIPVEAASDLSGRAFPSSLLEPAPDWSSFRAIRTGAGGETHTLSRDGRLARLDVAPAGVEPIAIEVSGALAYSRDGSTGQWVEAPAGVDTMVAAFPLGVEPLTVSDLFPRSADPFITKHSATRQGLDESLTYRFELTFDVAAFRRDAPLQSEIWLSVHGPELDGTLEWTVDARSDGYIVRLLERSTGTEVRWEDLAVPLIAESPVG